MSNELHVAKTGSDRADGSAEHPFLTINHAAQIARPGDTVIVHAGTYREWVDPRNGGLSDHRRVTYRAAEGEQVLISGAEVVDSWVAEGGGIWRAEVSNEMFGDFNPFAEVLAGDWVVNRPGEALKHLGDVYLNGRSCFEAGSRADLAAAAVRSEVVDDWTGTTVPTHDPDSTKYVWFAEVGESTTQIWVNAHELDLDSTEVLISVRRSVFSPRRNHVNYITVRGFELAHAATPWAPPTADQPGLIGPNWAKGWVIEDNKIHDAKCSAVSLGKEWTTGHNFSTERGDKPGYQYQLESVFLARQIGWDRERIGSHVVRRNEIYDCGQNGIVGHLGCVFSTIEDNHIHHIATKREFYGYEIGGIKLHAAIDVQIRHNRIHDTSLGIWLDWETQGTRVSRNLFYQNNRDIFVEVSHGPYLVDHNVFASPASIEIFSQGGAYVNNLIAGTVRVEPVLDRATPYHRPHSTEVAGYAIIQAGDDRFIGNAFLGGDAEQAYGPVAEGRAPAHYGTLAYDEHPASMEQYLASVAEQPPGDHQRFAGLPQAVYLRDNVYFAGAQAYQHETNATMAAANGHLTVVEETDGVYVEFDQVAELAAATVETVTGVDLPRVRFVDAEFEDVDGTSITVDRDLLGETKAVGQRYPVGPFNELPTDGRIKVW